MAMKSGLVCRRLAFKWPDDDFGDEWVLRAHSARFAPATITLISGATGAGKSTLLHLLAGLLRPSAGEIWADGQPVSRWPARHRDPWRRQVGIVFQHLGLIPDLTVMENLLLPLLPRRLKHARLQADLSRWIAEAGLSAMADRPAGALSGGQRQRLAIARALVVRPRFVLADEPSAYQDDTHVVRIGGQLADAARQGAVVVICSHDPRLRESTAVDHHLRLADGKLLPEDDRQAER